MYRRCEKRSGAITVAYDEGLLELLRDVMADIPGVTEKKIIGAYAFWLLAICAVWYSE